MYATEPNKKIIGISSISPIFFSKKMSLSRTSLENLFILWNSAIQSFLCQNLRQHDALVGENACHLRAASLIDTWFNPEIKKTLITISNTLNEAVQKLKCIEICSHDDKGTILDFICKHNLVEWLPEHTIPSLRLIINSYLLTLTKKKLPQLGLTLSETTCYKKVSTLGFTKRTIKKLISETQKLLSADSCNFILSEAKGIENNAIQNLLKIEYDDHQRSHLPQFIAGKVVLQHILEKKRYIIVKVTRYVDHRKKDEITLLLRPNATLSDFELTTEVPAINIPCIISNGAMNYFGKSETKKSYISRLISHSFLDIFQATFASHPQYSGKLKHLPPPFQESISLLTNRLLEENTTTERKKIQETLTKIYDEQIDYNYKKKYASENGLSIGNPSLLLFNHIYADNLSNHIDCHCQGVNSNKMLELEY